MSSTLIAWQT